MDYYPKQTKATQRMRKKRRQEWIQLDHLQVILGKRWQPRFLGREMKNWSNILDGKLKGGVRKKEVLAY